MALIMDFIEILKAIVQGIVQGITEWLPISSTGHILLLDAIWPMNVSPDFFNVFKVVIQLGSIMAVVVLYFHKLNPVFSQKEPEGKGGHLSSVGKGADSQYSGGCCRYGAQRFNRFQAIVSLGHRRRPHFIWGGLYLDGIPEKAAQNRQLSGDVL